jgi:large subunit ribosomal protein L15
MKLNNLNDNVGAISPRKRLGRGTGSGLGKTSGRGHKGQKSRSGSTINGFEGGQMPIHRRLPKRGFKKYNRKIYKIINLGDLQKSIDIGKIDASKPIDTSAILASGLVSTQNDGIRLLARGKITSKVEIQVTGASTAAIENVKKAGGNVNLISKNKDN